jgi:hypothetical protein
MNPFIARPRELTRARERRRACIDQDRYPALVGIVNRPRKRLTPTRTITPPLYPECRGALPASRRRHGR